MPTLANIQGSSLVSQFGDPFAEGIKGLQGRRRETAATSELEDLIRGSLGLPGLDRPSQPSGEGLLAQLTGPGGLFGGQQGTALPEQRPDSGGILGRLAPGLAQAINGARGNPQQEAELRQEADKGVTLATELQALPDHAARVRRLAQQSGEMVSSGEDIGRITALANLPPDQLDLELMKMQVVGKQAQKQLPALDRQGAIAAVMARNPAQGASLLARRDAEIAAEQARRAAASRAAAAARAPQTDLGRGLADIRQDMSTGNISEEVGQQMIANLRADATAVDTPDFSGKVPENFMLRNPANPREGVVPIPGAPITEADLSAVAETQNLLAEAGVEQGSPDWVRAVEAAAGVTDDPATTAQKEYAQAVSQGFTGTLEDWKTGLANAGAPSVTVTTGGEFKMPPGFKENPDFDPSKPSGPDNRDVVPIVGGPQDPATPTKTTLTAAVKVANASDALDKGLNDFLEVVRKEGVAVVPGIGKDALLTARRAVQLQMKELFNLGVLNGPDLELMDQLLFDPTAAESVASGALAQIGIGDTTTDRAEANIARLQEIFKDISESQRPPGVEPKQAAPPVSTAISPGTDIGPSSGPDGTTATNPATGETIIVKDGRWVTQ